MTPGRTLIYDADCGFCTRSARWLAAGQDWSPVPWQATDLDALGLTEAMVTTAAYWVDGGTVRAEGAAAIAAALRTRPGWPRLAGRVIDSGPVRPLARLVYGLVARNRHQMPGGSDACRLPQAP